MEDRVLEDGLPDSLPNIEWTIEEDVAPPEETEAASPEEAPAESAEPAAAAEAEEPTPKAEAEEEAAAEAKEPTPKAEVESDPLADRLNALAEREAKLIEERDAFKREQEHTTRELEARFEERIAKIEQGWKDNPLETAKKYGWEFDTLAEHAIKGRTAPPPEVTVNQVKQEVMQLRRELTQERHQRAQERLMNEAAAAVQGEKYALLAGFHDNPAQAVFDGVVETYKGEKRFLTSQEAAERIESYWEERLKSLGDAQKQKIGRILGFLEEETEAQEAPSKTAPQPKQKKTKETRTVTNDMSAETAPPAGEITLLDDVQIANFDEQLVADARKLLLGRS